MRAICPNCAGTHVKKRGIRRGLQRWTCNICSRYFSTPEYTAGGIMPKILLFDIETALMEVYVWGLFKQRIPHTNIIKDRNGNEKSWFVLSWAAKWLYGDIMSDIVTPDEAKARDDKRVLTSIWKLLDEADIVIAHNGDRFDIRKLNARFLDNGMDPPSPFKTIDTLKVAKRHFAFVSYKQDFLTKHFKLEQKLKTDIQLWIDCRNGKKEALDRMNTYNEHDVLGLEEVYLKVRPYIKNHPNLGILLDMDVCPNCACENMEETEAVYLTGANKFPVYRCEGCKTPYIRHKKNSVQVKTNYRSVAS